MHESRKGEQAGEDEGIDHVEPDDPRQGRYEDDPRYERGDGYKPRSSSILIPRGSSSFEERDIKTCSNCRKIKEFAGLCNTTAPQDILDRMEPVMNMPEEMRKLGVEFAVRHCEDLKKTV